MDEIESIARKLNNFIRLLITIQMLKEDSVKISG